MAISVKLNYTIRLDAALTAKQEPLTFDARLSAKAILPDPFDWECLKDENLLTASKVVLIGFSAATGAATAVFTLFGMVPPAIVSGVLCVASATAAYAAHRVLGDFEEAKKKAEELGKRITELRSEIDTFSAQNSRLGRRVDDLTAQLGVMRGENDRFRQNNADLEAQNAEFNQNIDNLTAQLAQFSVQNENQRAIGAQFAAYLEQFRQGGMQDRQGFAQKIVEFAQQIAASQALWNQILQASRAIQGDYAAQLNQLREIARTLTDPRTTLVRLEEHREINLRIQEATQQLSALTAQIALRDGELRGRDQLLAELRSAHQQILAEYGGHNTALSLQIDRISRLLQQSMSASTVEVVVPCDIGFGNTLGVRCETNWSESIRFTHTPAGWKGQIPLGRAFKFVFTSSLGEVRWEKTENRWIRESSRAQQEVVTRRIEF